MTRTVVRENGQVTEIREDGKIVYSRKEELKDVAEAAAKAAIQETEGVSGDEQQAADAARKAVKESLGQ